MLEKRQVLSLEEIEGQTALELPDREMMTLVKVTVGNVTVLKDINVAANICGLDVNVLAAQLDKGTVTCKNGAQINK